MKFADEIRKFPSSFAKHAELVMEAFDEQKHPRSDDGKFGPGSSHTSDSGSAHYTTNGEYHEIHVKHGEKEHLFSVSKHPKKPGARVSHTGERPLFPSTYHISPEHTSSSGDPHEIMAQNVVNKHVRKGEQGSVGTIKDHPHLHAASKMIAHAIKHFAGGGDK